MVSEIANVPVEFKLQVGGVERVFKIRRLSILELTGNFEALVRSERIKDIGDLVLVIPKEDRPLFYKQAMASLPKGTELSRLASDRMNGNDGGVRILKAALGSCQPITDEDLKLIVNNQSNSEHISGIITFALGSDETPDDQPSEKKSE